MRSRRIKKNDIDFFGALRRAQRHGKSRSRQKTLRFFGGAAVLLAAAVAAHGMLLSRQISDMREQIAAEEAYLAAPENREAFEAREAMAAARGALADYNGRSGRYIEALEAARRLTSADFDGVDAARPANVSVERYLFSGETMELSCTSPDKDAPALYAENLAGTGRFREVGYSGFQYRGPGDGGVYAFTVTCRLWDAGAGTEGGDAP